MFIGAIILGVIFLLVIMTKDKWMFTQEISSNAYLIDVRTPSEFKNGSVPNARNIPLSEISMFVDELSNKVNIVVFCRSGIRSANAKKILESNGIENVVNGGSLKNVQNALRVKNN